MSRLLKLNQGQSPGDILVFTAAVTDLAEQYPDYDIQVTSPCNAIFENNPFVNKNKEFKPEKLKYYPNALEKAGYDLYDIATNYKQIFKGLIEKQKLGFQLNEKNNVWEYTLKGEVLFSTKNKVDFSKKREFFDIQYSEFEPGISQSGWSGRHFSSAFYKDLEGRLGIKIKQTSLRPRLFLSDDEKSWMNQVEEETGYRGKFWLINCGTKSDYPLKQWPLNYWQEMINLLKDKIQFVQVGAVEKNHAHTPMDNVIDLVGKTDFRQLIRLSYHAEGAVSHVSMLHHLMAAWEKPCVTIAGGREPRRWESYPNTRYLDTNGLLPCCDWDGCWQSGRLNDEGKNKTCKNQVGNKPKCMMMIKPERVAEEIMNHYYGGRLSF